MSNLISARALRLALAAICAVPLLAPGGATAQTDPHLHGAADLRIVVEGARLEIALESPLDNLLGFEHAPRNDRQRKAARAMAAKLRDAKALFTPTPEARCSPTSVDLASDALPAALLAVPGAPPEASAATPAPVTPAPAKGGTAATADADAHADVDVAWTWHCEAPAELKGVDVGLMRAFPGFRKLAVQVVGPRGQSAATLTRGQRKIAW